MRQRNGAAILSDMESFSTPSRSIVPTLANLATLVAVVSATGWSGWHRPAHAQPALTVKAQNAPSTAAAVSNRNNLQDLRAARESADPPSWQKPGVARNEPLGSELELRSVGFHGSKGTY